MNTEDLKTLIGGNKTIEFIDDDQDPAHGLRLLVIDHETNEVGELSIKPRALVLPDEVALDYSYQVVAERGPIFDECLYTISTPIESDYQRKDVPFLNGGQGGLF